LGGRGRWISEFEASLVYKVSSRTARATEKPCLEKTTTTTTKKKKKKKKKNNQPNQTKNQLDHIKYMVKGNEEECFKLRYLKFVY
jgi:hypothetical protein